MENKMSKRVLDKSMLRIRILGATFGLLLLLIGSSYYLTVVAPSFAKAFSGSGAGSPDEPYQITTCTQLQEINEQPNQNYVLMNDIDCGDTENWNNGAGFTPIYNFSSTFDGRNYEIKDLYINLPSQYGVGLFTYPAGQGVFKNVKLTKSPVNANRVDISGGRIVGALVDEMRGSEINNVHSSLTVQSDGSADGAEGNYVAVGGLVGLNNSIIRRSSSDGKVMVPGDSNVTISVEAGGLVGNMSTSSAFSPGLTQIEDSYSKATVDVGTNDTVTNGSCGGLVGVIVRSEGIEANIYRSYAAGSVECKSSSGVPNTGGFVGGISLAGSAGGFPLLVDNFTVAEVKNAANSSAFYGAIYYGIGTSYAVDYESNRFDITRTTKSACGPASDAVVGCIGVNADNTQPNFFTQESQGGFFANWNQSTIWQLAPDGYPTIRTTEVMSEAPTNLSVSRQDNDFILTWDAPAGNQGRADGITAYRVYYRDENSSNPFWQEYDADNLPDANTTTKTVTGLTIPGNYSFRVRAIYLESNTNLTLSGLYSSAYQFATGMPESAPTNFEVTPNVYTTSATWQAVDAAAGYTLEYRRPGDAEWASQNVEAPTTNTKLVLLQADTDYEFRIRAYNAGGPGPWSDIVAARSKTPTTKTVATCQELQDINNDLEANYLQTADIDCSSIANFQVIGGANDVFLGSYDGRGYKISNLTIQADIQTENDAFSGVGLFGVVAGADLKNITLDNPTVSGNFLVDPGVDADGNGLPDEPDLPAAPAVPDGIGVTPPTSNDVTTTLGDIQSSATQIGQTGFSYSQSLYGVFLSYGTTATASFPRFAVGGVAGVMTGNGTISNIKVNNAAILGNVSGGVFGAVVPLPNIADVPDVIGDAYFSQGAQEAPDKLIANFNQTLTIDGLSSSGSVDGFVTGGLIGVASSPLGPIFNAGGEFILQNSTSSANVGGNVAGGLVGGGLSLSIGARAASIISTQANGGTTQEQLAAGLNGFDSVSRTQAVIIRNSSASGTVSACNALTYALSGLLGGAIGVGTGVLLDNVTATGEVTTCSGSTEQRLAYGGFMGGLSGALLVSRIESSTASGAVRTIRNPETNDNEAGLYFGVTGGLSGALLGLGEDTDGRYMVNNSSARGNIDVVGNGGLVSISGGITGLYLGTGTINNSFATGNVSTTSAQENVGSVTISGGITGVTLGLDAPFLLKTAGSAVAGYPTKFPLGHGADVQNSYATGNVTSRKEGSSGMFAITGGATGLVIGSSNLITSYATGAVTSGIPDDFELGNGQGGALQRTISTSFGTAISGGLVGVGLGVDAPGAGTTVMAGFGIRSIEDIQRYRGLYIDNSYAKGAVKANVAGGLVGAAELKTQINKAYAEGNVEGQVAGGLVGSSGLFNVAGLVGTVFGSQQVKSSIEDPSDVRSDEEKAAELGRIGQLFNSVNTVGGPVEITNTYATGSVTAKTYTINVNNLRKEDDFYPSLGSDPLIPVRLPAIAGGIAGFFVGPGSILKDSYSAGEVKVASPPEQVRNEKLKIADIPSFAGGVFGINVDVPLPDYVKIIAPTPGGEQPLATTDFLQSPTRLENVFSASKLSLSPTTFTGGSAGLYVSPLHFIDAFLLGNTRDKTKDERISVKSNIYFDKSQVSVGDCSGPNDKFTNIVNQTYNRSFIQKDSGGENLLPQIPVDISNTETLNEEAKPIVDKINELVGLKTACQFVNSDNSQPGYFKNNKVNAPLNEWDFGNVWVVRKDDYPKFVAGATITNLPPPTTPTTTTTASLIPVPEDQQGSRVLRRLLVPAQPAAFNTNTDSLLKRILQQVPPFIAKTLPYLIMLMLLILAARYGRQALREYRAHSFYHRSIKRIVGTKSAINDYLAITTHYLNTPAAIMSSALELLLGAKKLPEVEVKGLQSKVKSYAEMAGRLLSMNQVSASASVVPQKVVSKKLPNPFRQKEVYMPILIAAGLLVLVNVLFMYADVYNRSVFRLAIEFGYLTLSAGLVVLAYRYRFFMENNKEIAKKQLATESEFFMKREEFVRHAAIVTHDNHLMLDVASKKLKKIPESRLFFNGLAMLGSMSKGLNDIQKYSDFSSNPPLLDLSASTNKAIRQVISEAGKRNIKLDTHVRSGVATKIAPAEYDQIINSLLDNALKFSKDGGKIWISLYRRLNKIVLVVSDDGEGISKDKLPSLLKPFSRATDSMEYNHEGAGLSLYTNKVIVNKYDGSLEIDSELGSGTNVRVTLPLLHGDSPQSSILVKPNTVTELGSGSKDAGQKKK